jgi:hypothetical protein
MLPPLIVTEPPAPSWRAFGTGPVVVNRMWLPVLLDPDRKMCRVAAPQSSLRRTLPLWSRRCDAHLRQRVLRLTSALLLW